VLRSCCVEPFVAVGKTLKLLSLAGSTAQHGFRRQNETRIRLSC
jgi:hypothetical protein